MKNVFFSDVRFIKTAFKKEDFLFDRKSVLFIGRSNVGKSSLINSLTMNKVMKVSKTPGLTKGLNYCLVDSSFYLVDAPGYGYARNERDNFAKMMDDFIFSSKNLKKVYMLIDSRRLFFEADLELAKEIKSASIPLTYIFTKIDKLDKKEKYALDSLIQTLDDEYFLVSSKDQENLSKIRKNIYNTVSK